MTVTTTVMKVAKEVKEKVEDLTEKTVHEMRIFAEGLRVTVRAAQGLELDEDHGQVLVQPKDIRERTRVDAFEQYQRTYLRALAKKYPYEMAIASDLAEGLDHYAISLNMGEGRREYLLSQRKTETVLQGMPLALPSVQTQAPLNEPKQQEKVKVK